MDPKQRNHHESTGSTTSEPNLKQKRQYNDASDSSKAQESSRLSQRPRLSERCENPNDTENRANSVEPETAYPPFTPLSDPYDALLVPEGLKPLKTDFERLKQFDLAVPEEDYIAYKTELADLEAKEDKDVHDRRWIRHLRTNIRLYEIDVKRRDQHVTIVSCLQHMARQLEIVSIASHRLFISQVRKSIPSSRSRPSKRTKEHSH